MHIFDNILDKNYYYDLPSFKSNFAYYSIIFHFHSYSDYVFILYLLFFINIKNRNYYFLIIKTIY